MPPKPKVPGLIKGLGVTFGEMVKTLKDGPQTTRYPHEREEVSPRARGVIALHEENCTSCMYCGICVEVCPFDALFWSPEHEYSEVRIADLLHDKSRLDQWMQTVPDYEPYEAGADAKVKKVPR